MTMSVLEIFEHHLCYDVVISMDSVLTAPCSQRMLALKAQRDDQVCEALGHHVCFLSLKRMVRAP